MSPCCGGGTNSDSHYFVLALKTVIFVCACDNFWGSGLGVGQLAGLTLKCI